MNALTWNNDGISDRGWWFCNVYTCYIPGLTLEGIDLNTKDHVTPHKQMCRWYIIVTMQDVECYSKSLHFHQNRVGPICITILVVCAICIFHCLGNLDTTFVC